MQQARCSVHADDQAACAKNAVLLPSLAEPAPASLLERREFALPQSLLEKRDALRSQVQAKLRPPPYRLIRRNVYLCRPRRYSPAPVCQCPPGSGCDDRCMNRQMQIICNPRTCPNGSACTNTRLGKRKAPELEVAYYGARGFGLRTPRRVTAGSFLGEYCGELIDMPEAARRVRDVYMAQRKYYFVEYCAAAGEMLDGGFRGSNIRFVNHSCSPNCYLEKWLVGGDEEDMTAEYEVGLFALRDIEAGEELTYKYGWSEFNRGDANGQAGDHPVPAPEKCHCGSINCTGFLGKERRRVVNGTPVVMRAPLQPKRGPGRPRKQDAIPPHRGPGRPRKVELVPKRRPGRPRKERPVLDAVPSALIQPETPRRRPGRPRKAPQPPPVLAPLPAPLPEPLPAADEPLGRGHRRRIQRTLEEWERPADREAQRGQVPAAATQRRVPLRPSALRRHADQLPKHATAARRGPGRPRKYQPEAPARRGPGRPRKHQPEAPARRGPGRPRKRPVEETEAPQPPEKRQQTAEAAPRYPSESQGAEPEDLMLEIEPSLRMLGSVPGDASSSQREPPASGATSESAPGFSSPSSRQSSRSTQGPASPALSDAPEIEQLLLKGASDEREIPLVVLPSAPASWPLFAPQERGDVAL